MSRGTECMHSHSALFSTLACSGFPSLAVVPPTAGVFLPQLMQSGWSLIDIYAHRLSQSRQFLTVTHFPGDTKSHICGELNIALLAFPYFMNSFSAQYFHIKSKAPWSGLFYAEKLPDNYLGSLNSCFSCQFSILNNIQNRSLVIKL